MADLTWSVVEEALLKAVQTELGSLVQTVATYQGNWLHDLQHQARRLPAVLVRLQKARGEEVAMRSANLILDFTVLVAVRPLRGETESRVQEGGIYQILEGVRRALWHQDLGLAITPFSLEKEEPWLYTRELAVYGAEYRTSLVKDF
ncbi:MAG: phage protein Gp37 [Thermodesulfobacteriota bacterium]